MFSIKKGLVTSLIVLSIYSIYSESNYFKNIETELYTFNVSLIGDPTGTPVILLHGFPETAYMWEQLQKDLAEKGYFTIAPNQRGYSEGARPKGKSNYSLQKLSTDVIDIADALGIEKFHLIGHDWGSAVGWNVSYKYENRVLSWTSMSVPHPDAFSRGIMTNEVQNKAIDYMRMFQWPLLPEFFLKINDHKKLKSIWNVLEEDQIEAHLSILKQKGALTSAINWYRANYKDLSKGTTKVGNINIPTLFIWGKNDSAILEVSVGYNKDYVKDSFREIFLESGHWLIEESYEQVYSEILAHLENHR